MFAFVKSRPPLVVFFCCLVTFTVAIIYFAVYIKYTDSVPDTDKNHDWLQMLKHFNNLEYCLSLKPSNHFLLAKDFIEQKTVQVLVSINNTDEYNLLNFVRGCLTIEDWHTNCHKRYSKPSYLEIYFNVPQLPKNVTKFDVCVTLRGPEEYLPKFSEPNCVIPTETAEKSNGLEAFVDTEMSSKLEKGFCQKGVFTKFEFHPQEKDKFANFLTLGEKDIIYVHLLWITFILIFLLLLIVIYGAFYKEHIFDKYTK